MRLTTFAVLAVAAASVVAVPTASSAADSPVVLVAETEAGIVQLDLGTGAVLRLLVPGGRSPDVSPDGRRLVFGLREGNAQHLWTSDVDGSNRRQLTSGPAFDSDPDWSPDGSQIALCHGSAPYTRNTLALIRPDGSGARVIPGTKGSCGPSWSPDSQLLVYGSPDGVRVIDSEGRNSELLTTVGTTPAWSPDGVKVAVTSYGSESDITLVDVRTGQRNKITEFEGYHVIWVNPAWSPDGASLYTTDLTESFPDEQNQTTVGFHIQRRHGDGTHPAFWSDGARTPTLGGGPRPAGDDVPPAPVAATATATISGIDVEAGPQLEPDGAGF